MSIRMTRREYADSHPQRRRRLTVREVAMKMATRMKKSLLAQGLIKHTPKKEWQYCLPGGGPTAVVYAHTRSEARAEIKKTLGIKKGRLPMGVILYEVVPERAGAA